jgi:hypothetical protein
MTKVWDAYFRNLFSQSGLIFPGHSEKRQAEQAAEKVDYFVIPSEARNLSGF